MMWRPAAATAATPLSSILISLSLFLWQAQAICYFPNGKTASQDGPCRDDTEHSACCGQGFACLSNGMCVAVVDLVRPPELIPYHRASCTDKSWRSGDCPNFCVDSDVDRLDWAVSMGVCPNSDSAFFCNRKKGAKSDCQNNKNLVSFSG